MKFNLMAHVLTCAFLLFGCDAPSTAAPPVAPPPPLPSAPESMTGYFCFETSELGSLRSAVDTPALAAMITSSARAFIISQFDEPPAASETVNENSRVCGLALNTEFIVAAETTPTSPHVFDTWHGDARHFGNVAVFGERELVERAGPYLARVVFDKEMDAPLTFHVEDGVLADQLRPLLDEHLRSAALDARAAAQAERATRDSDADFGDPQAFVRVVERRLRGLLQWLPDLGAVTIEVRAQGGAVHLDATMDLHADSPLAAFVASAPAQEAAFDRLPRGTALAYSRASEGESVLAALVEVAGTRADAEEAQALLALAEELPSPFTLALGTSGGTSAWLDYQGDVPVDENVRGALSGDYLRALTSAAFDCPMPPRSWPAEATQGRCRLPALDVRQGGMSLGRAPREVVGADPDIARLVAGSPPILGGLYLDVLRLPAALSLFTALDERPLSEDRPAPIVAMLHHADDALHLRLRCAPGSIANVVDVVLSLVL